MSVVLLVVDICYVASGCLLTVAESLDVCNYVDRVTECLLLC